MSVEATHNKTFEKLAVKFTTKHKNKGKNQNQVEMLKESIE